MELVTRWEWRKVEVKGINPPNSWWRQEGCGDRTHMRPSPADLYLSQYTHSLAPPCSTTSITHYCIHAQRALQLSSYAGAPSAPSNLELSQLCHRVGTGVTEPFVGLYSKSCHSSGWSPLWRSRCLDKPQGREVVYSKHHAGAPAEDTTIGST